MKRLRTTALASVIASAVACGGPSVDRPDGGTLFEIDAGFVAPDAPRWTNVYERTPYEVTTLRGTSSAKRVIVFGGRNPVSSSVLPDGTFCVDQRLPRPGSYVFDMVALQPNGLTSDKSAPITVTYDPSAPEISNATTCAGAHPAGCVGAVEICGNNKDDDCNNLVDDDDPTCATCTNDPLEPNDDVYAPQVDPGRLEGLMLCPGDVDYYGVYVEGGERIEARILFAHAEGNLDLALYGVDRRTVVEQSLSLTNDEMITHTATASGVFSLSVFAESNASNAYILELDIR